MSMFLRVFLIKLNARAIILVYFSCCFISWGVLTPAEMFDFLREKDRAGRFLILVVFLFIEISFYRISYAIVEKLNKQAPGPWN